MKLLLTSGGLGNPSLTKALLDLIGKPFADAAVVFVPTASNMETGDKSWLIKDLVQLQDLGFASIDIADISAVDQDVWLPKFQAADILFFEGGNTYHLMHWINKSGLGAMLPEMLKTKVYVGVSAGSMVVGPDLWLRSSKELYNEDLDRYQEMTGLGLVDFYILPHLKSDYFSKLREDNIRAVATDVTRAVYALDDQSAVKVVDGVVEVVSEGAWFRVN